MTQNTFSITHKIKANPTAVQKQGMNLFCGHKRKAFNVLYDVENFWYRRARNGLCPYPRKEDLDKELIRIKRIPEFAYLNDAPSDVLQRAVVDLWTGINKARKRQANAPRHKRKDDYKQSFYISNEKGAIVYRGPKAFFKCPKLKKLCGNELIPLAEKPRFDGKIMSYTVTREGDNWFVTIAFELESNPHTCQKPDSVCGVDVGISTPAICSDGTELQMPDTSREEAKIRYYQAKMDRSRNANGRRQHVSNRYKKTQKKLRALQKRINNKRKDARHKFTHTVTNNHGTVVVESLNTKKIIRKMPGRGARRAAARAGMGETLRQLEYKAQNIKHAPWYYASSQLCSSCGHRHPMPLDQRTYVCDDCGLEMDRDLNAAINLANYISQPGQG